MASPWTIMVGETRAFSWDFANDLQDGDSLTGTPTVRVLKRTTSGVSEATEFTDSTISISGTSVVFKIEATSSAEEGKYGVEIQCGTSDGETVEATVGTSPAAAPVLYCRGM